MYLIYYSGKTKYIFLDDKLNSKFLNLIYYSGKTKYIFLDDKLNSKFLNFIKHPT